MNKKIVHDALILTVFTVVIGFILGLVYEITKDPIAKAEEATAQAAYKAVFEDADSFSTYDFDAEAAASLLEQNGYSDEINGVQEALDKDGNVFQPIFSDFMEFQKHYRQNAAKMRMAPLSIGQLPKYMVKESKGFVINPAGFNLQLSGEQIDTIVKAFPETKQQ